MGFTLNAGNARLVIVGRGYNNKSGYKDGVYVGSGTGDGPQIVNFFITKDDEFICTCVYDDALDPFPVASARVFYSTSNYESIDPQRDLKYTLSDGVNTGEFSANSVPLVKPGLLPLTAHLDSLQNVTRAIDIYVLDKLEALAIVDPPTKTHYSYNDKVDYRGLTVACTFAYANTIKYAVDSDDDSAVTSIFADNFYLKSGVVKWSDLSSKLWSELKKWNDLTDESDSEEDVYNPKSITTGAGDTVDTDASEHCNVKLYTASETYDDLYYSTDVDFGGTTFRVSYVFIEASDGSILFKQTKVTCANPYADHAYNNVSFTIDASGRATLDAGVNIELTQETETDETTGKEYYVYKYNIIKTYDEKQAVAGITLKLDKRKYQNLVINGTLDAGTMTALVARECNINFFVLYGVGQCRGYPFDTSVEPLPVTFDYDANVRETITTE